jgi:hypothetical protein
MGQDNNSQSSINSKSSIDDEVIDHITEDVLKVFASNKKNLTKSDCKKLLNIIFESLFDEKLKHKNFEFIYTLLNKNNNVFLSNDEIKPIIKALIVSFDVNYITNSSSFNDKVCIKIGKHLLPTYYYIKHEEDDD